VTERPWFVPVPVRRSDFVPLRAEHAELNVEVFLGGIGAFGATTTTGPLDVLRCDLQDNPDTSVQGRLGSGRTGVYRGAYLKGVGRTVLACNWANAADVRHHTGALDASAATRELVVSTYLRAKGCGDSIVGCDGVLLKPLAPELRGHVGASGTTLQALSVKSARFARFSNLVWLSNHLDFYRSGAGTTTLAQFVRIFLATLGEERADLATPATLAAAFYRSARRGLASLRAFFRLGVSWPSLHNNFAVDGRFVDIDWPVILGKPLVGVVATRGPHRRLELPHHDVQRGLFEPLYYVLHMRMLAQFFAGRFHAIAATGYPVRAREREFAREIARGFAGSPERRMLFSRREVTRMLHGWVTAEVELGATAQQRLAAAIETAYQALFAKKGTRRRVVELRPSFAPIATMGDTNPPVPHLLSFMPAREVFSEEAAFVNEVIDRLGRIGDRDRLLYALGDSMVKITEHCTAASPRLLEVGT
jgi:hypothetical protein